MSIIEQGPYRFACTTSIEEWRARSLFTKEEGTMRWLQVECLPGDVIYDIGANIGLYTVVAAVLGSFVYAFEPHAANLISLFENIRLNEVQERVRVLASALHWTTGFISFHYASTKAGSSGSQLGHTQSESGHEFIPLATELKHAISVDALLDQQVIRPATLIKLDVDGNELMILKGMEALLTQRPPRAVQVEVHPVDAAAIGEFMGKCGYRQADVHYTALGQKALAQGSDPESITRNVIFRV